MKSIHQLSHKKNFEVKYNDVFNLDRVPFLTLNEVRRGKKHVQNVRLSNFNGISLNLEYNKRAVEGTLNYMADIGEKASQSPPHNYISTDGNSILVSKSSNINRKDLHLAKCDEIQIINVNNNTNKLLRQSQLIRSNPISDDHNNINTAINELSMENPILLRIDGIEKDHKPADEEKSHVVFNQNDRYATLDQQENRFGRLVLPPLQIASTPKVKNSRNIINNSMIKDYKNLTSLTSKAASGPNLINFENSIPAVAFAQSILSNQENKLRLNSAQFPYSTKNECNVSKILMNIL